MVQFFPSYYMQPIHNSKMQSTMLMFLSRGKLLQKFVLVARASGLSSNKLF